MSTEERYRLKLLTQVQQRKMTYREAAEHLEVSERHVYRLMRRYQSEGDAGLIHRLRGKPSNRGQSHAIRQHVIGLYKQQYGDYGPTLFTEQLLSAHNIALDHETVRRWLRSDGITHFERRRRKHRRKRERRSAIGELVQFDGSPTIGWRGVVRPAVCFTQLMMPRAGSSCVLRHRKTVPMSWQHFASIVSASAFPKHCILTTAASFMARTS
jgi:transposase